MLHSDHGVVLSIIRHNEHLQLILLLPNHQNIVRNSDFTSYLDIEVPILKKIGPLASLADMQSLIRQTGYPHMKHLHLHAQKRIHGWIPKPPAIVTDWLCRNLKCTLTCVLNLFSKDQRRLKTQNHSQSCVAPTPPTSLVPSAAPLHYNFVSLQQLVSSDMALQVAVTVPVFAFASGKGGELLCLSRCAQQFNFTALSQIRA